jgi:integrase
MTRTRHRLSARTVATVSEPGRHADGGNLFLNVTLTGTRSWLFIYARNGKSYELGAGKFPDVSLATARERAEAARTLVAQGLDPRPALKPEAVADAEIPTFGAFADALLQEIKTGWRNPKHVAQWEMSLGAKDIDFARVKPEHLKETKKHRDALERLRRERIDQVNADHVLAVISPLWNLKPESASRLRGRIEHVLDAAKAKKLRSGENPALWRGGLQPLLPRRQRLTRGHHSALPFKRLPEFMEKLRQQNSTAALALEFGILTAARTGEIIGATWAEIDAEDAVWVIPAQRMKAGKEHRVPLSKRCIELIAKVRLLHDGAPDDVLFPSPRKDARTGKAKSLSNAAMMAAMKRAGFGEFTVHGFRSSFRDWGGEASTFPREVLEQALAHVIQNKAEAAYRRADALEKRRKLIAAWEAYCEPRTGTVVPMTKVAR